MADSLWHARSAACGAAEACGHPPGKKSRGRVLSGSCRKKCGIVGQAGPPKNFTHRAGVSVPCPPHQCGGQPILRGETVAVALGGTLIAAELSPLVPLGKPLAAKGRRPRGLKRLRLH